MAEQTIPELFVEQQFLPNKWLPTTQKTKYNINGQVFRLENDDNDDYYQFEVVSDSDTESECGAVLDEKYSDFLPVFIQKTTNGYIVNNTILLPVNNWNTIIWLDDHIWCCVCMNIATDAIAHIQSNTHVKNMEKYQPLQKFDLSIVRLIDDHYHCAVCNETFHVSKYNHFKTQSHESMQLNAIKSCSDVQNVEMNDMEQNHLIEQSLAHSFDQSKTHSFDHSPTISSAHSQTDYVESVSSTIESGIEDLNESDGFYDITPSPSNIKNVKQPIQATYASVAKAVPKILYINWFGTKYKIDHNAWNMLLTMKSTSKIYCMACREVYDLPQTNVHSLETAHIERLKLCTPVEKYKNYIIRKVDEKFLHCANCNNLQLETTIAEHIEQKHGKKANSIKNKIEGSRKKKDVKKETSELDENNITKTMDKGNQESAAKDQNNVIEQSQGHVCDLTRAGVVIRQFGCNIKIPLLSYNLMFITRNNDYYCNLCNKILLKRDALHHLNDRIHLCLMQRPFLHNLGVNLIRVINILLENNIVRLNGGLHCALCHYAFVNHHLELNKHIASSSHVFNLNKALCNTREHNVYTEIKEQKIEKENVGNMESNTNKEIDATTVVKPEDDLVDDSNVENIQHSGENVSNSNSIDIIDIVLNECKRDTKDDTKDIYTEMTNMVIDQGLGKRTEHELRSVNEMFFEKIVVAKLKNNNVKISFASYNTFVPVGNGCWYCVVCSMEQANLGTHFIASNHLKNLKKLNFIDRYDVNLIRQNSKFYHCGICNAIIQKEALQTHITWNAHKNILFNIKNRSRDLKNFKVIEISLTKETQFDEVVLHSKIVANYKFEVVNPTSVNKRNKFITHDGNTFKLTWDAWHSLSKNKNGYRCILCCADLKNYDLSGHVNSERHSKLLHRFEKQYLPALVRKVNDLLLNCLTCNSEVSSKKHILLQHIMGKKHLKNHQAILSVADEVLDDSDVLCLNL